MRLLTNLEFTDINNTITNRDTGERRKVDREIFSQLYSLDVEKQLSTTLTVGGGGIFEDDDINGKIDGVEQDNRTKRTRPYAQLSLDTPLLRGNTNYRKNKIKETATSSDTSRRYVNQFINSLSWKPVDLPEFELYYSNTHAYNKANSTEEKIDREIDSYQFQSRYNYKNFRYDYTHTFTDNRDKETDFKTKGYTDILAVRHTKRFQQDKFTLNSSGRYKRDKSEFSGTGDRRVPTAVLGSTFYNLDDPPPATTNSPGDFTYNQSLTAINLLQDGAPQLSFGLDFSTPTDVDTVYVQLVEPTPLNDQATSGEVDGIEQLYTWFVYISEDMLNWTSVPITENTYDVFENRFEISFEPSRTIFVKVAVTPLPEQLLPNKEIRLSRISSYRTLPDDTDEFTTTQWTGELGLIWRMSRKTTSSYDILYREEESDPFDNRRTLLNTNASVSHRFNPIFFGSMRLLRAAVNERNSSDRVAYNYSTSLAANYLETFRQSLTYSYSHVDDDEQGTNSNHTILLRNILGLYEGLDMTVDGGHSWVDPLRGESSNVTFVRVDTNIVPNRWMNYNLLYDWSLDRASGETVRDKHTVRLFASWVPYPTISMNADVQWSKETGREDNTENRERYYFNWSPFRGGTMQFSFSYSRTDEPDGESSETLSPTLRWTVNPKLLLTCEYSNGERKTRTEKNDFESTRLYLRWYY